MTWQNQYVAGCDTRDMTQTGHYVFYETYVMDLIQIELRQTPMNENILSQQRKVHDKKTLLTGNYINIFNTKEYFSHTFLKIESILQSHVLIFSGYQVFLTFKDST